MVYYSSKIRVGVGEKTALHLDIELTAEDKRKLFEAAYTAGVTPKDLIAGFIGDLVAGEDTGGSDERDLATQWLARRYMPEASLREYLPWALYYSRMEEICDGLTTKEEAEKELAWYNEHPEDAAEGEVEEIQRDLAAANQELADIYSAYAEVRRQHGEEPQPMADGMAAIRAYLEELGEE